MRPLFTFLLFAAACGLHADTIVMKTGQKLEGKVLSSNGETVELEVEYGTMRVPAALILSVEQDTPEKIAAREEEKAQEKELVEAMRAEGKVFYKGKWVDEAEKEEVEAKLAEEKKKKEEEKAAAKKKKEEEAAKKREEIRKREEDERKRKEQLAQQEGRYDPRAERFNRNRGRDDNNTTNNNNNYNNNSRNRYNNNYQNDAVNDYRRTRNR